MATVVAGAAIHANYTLETGWQSLKAEQGHKMNFKA